MVFAYAGTLSLAEELSPIPLEEMEQDVFFEGGSQTLCHCGGYGGKSGYWGKIFLLAKVTCLLRIFIF